jgi:hypothetical protein
MKEPWFYIELSWLAGITGQSIYLVVDCFDLQKHQ